MIVVLALLLTAACQRAANDGTEPVAECQAYEQAMERCTGRHEPISTQREALPTSDQQRELLRKVCSENLARLARGCP